MAAQNAMTAEQIIENAVENASDTFDETDGSIPFGFVQLTGLDGRRKGTKTAKDVDGVTVDKTDYYGTTLTLDVVGGQSIAPKKAAYREFLDVCQEHGLFEDARIQSMRD